MIKVVSGVPGDFREISGALQVFVVFHEASEDFLGGFRGISGKLRDFQKVYGEFQRVSRTLQLVCGGALSRAFPVVSGGFQKISGAFEGNSWTFQDVPGGFRSDLGSLNVVPGGLMIQGISRDFRRAPEGLRGALGSLRRFSGDHRGVSGGVIGFQGVPDCLRGVSGGFRVCEGVRGM